MGYPTTMAKVEARRGTLVLYVGAGINTLVPRENQTLDYITQPAGSSDERGEASDHVRDGSIRRVMLVQSAMGISLE